MKISLAQLAANVGKSERTVLRWIKQGKLQAERLPDGKYEVSGMDMSADVGTEILARLSAIESRLERIESLLRREQGYQQIAPPVRVLRENYEPSTPGPVVLKPPAQKPSAPAPIADLPDGTLTLAEMARDLGISRSTLVGYCTRGTLAHESRPLQSRPNEHARFFTPEQAAAARAWHAEHSKK